MKKELIDIVRELKKQDNIQLAYLDNTPSEFTGVLVDNQYAESVAMSNTIMMKYIFGEYYEDISWFLCEWVAGKKSPQIWLQDGTEIDLETEEDYYNYLKECC